MSEYERWKKDPQGFFADWLERASKTALEIPASVHPLVKKLLVR